METKLLTSKMLAYSSAACTFILLAKTSEAQIIYTDVDPDETHSGDDNPGDFSQVLIDLDNNGSMDVIIGAYGTVSEGVVQMLVISGPASDYSIAYTNKYMAGKIFPSIGEFGAYPYVLSNGDEINNSINWFNPFQMIDSDIFYAPLIGYDGLTSRGYWSLDQTDKFLGIKVKIDDNLYFGWIRIDVTEYNEFTLKDYAFNLTPNEGITAGSIPVPVIGIASEQYAEIYSGNEHIYINLNPEISDLPKYEILNDLGQKILNGELSSNTNIIDLESIKPGIYIININSKHFNTSKKIYLH